MKLKAILATVFVAGLVVSMAIAAPAEKGKGTSGTTAAESTGTGGTTTGTTTEAGKKGKHKGRKLDCKPRRAAVLVGDFVSAGASSFAMSVKGGNKIGKALAGKQVTVNTTEWTKLRRSGKAKLSDLEAGDLLLVQGRACKLDTQALTLVAQKVVVLSPSDDDEEDGEDEDEGTTSTSTTTTSTTTTTTTS